MLDETCWTHRPTFVVSLGH